MTEQQPLSYYTPGIENAKTSRLLWAAAIAITLTGGYQITKTCYTLFDHFPYYAEARYLIYMLLNVGLGVAHVSVGILAIRRQMLARYLVIPLAALAIMNALQSAFRYAAFQNRYEIERSMLIMLPLIYWPLLMVYFTQKSVGRILNANAWRPALGWPAFTWACFAIGITLQVLALNGITFPRSTNSDASQQQLNLLMSLSIVVFGVFVLLGSEWALTALLLNAILLSLLRSLTFTFSEKHIKFFLEYPLIGLNYLMNDTTFRYAAIAVSGIFVYRDQKRSGIVTAAVVEHEVDGHPHP